MLFAVGAVSLARLPSGTPDQQLTERPAATTASTSSEQATASVNTGGSRGPTASGSSGSPSDGGKRITINFAGDINFTGALASALAADPGSALASIAPALGKADLTAVNLETSITDRGTPAPKQFTFRAPATALTALKAAGVDVATVANNHGLDYGPVVVDDALAASKTKRLPIIGVGHDERQAMAPYRKAIGGHRVSMIGATQVIDNNLITDWTATATHPGLASAKRVDQLVAAVKAERPHADTLVVFLHWGIELHTCPTADQQGLAHRLVDAGADIVIGSHAHVLLGAGRMGDAIVDYGLGNFAFAAQSTATAATGILQVDVGGGKPASYHWLPAQIGPTHVPSLLTGPAAKAAVAHWEGLRSCTGLAK